MSMSGRGARWALALLVALSGSARAQDVPVQGSDNVFLIDEGPHFGSLCNARRDFDHDPDFGPDSGPGIIARYRFEGEWQDNPFRGRLDWLVRAGLDVTERPFDAEPLIEALDRRPIHGHADLVARYDEVCTAMDKIGNRLVRVDYFSVPQDAGAVADMGEVGIAPVALGNSTPDFLPRPVARGLITFERWGARFAGPEWLALQPEFGAGLNAVYTLDGRLGSFGQGWVQRLLDAGYIVLSVDLAGKPAVLILDPHLIADRASLDARADPVRALDGLGGLVLQSIVYYPAAHRGIDDFALPAPLLADMRRQLRQVEQAREHVDARMARKMPDAAEINETLAAEWSRFAGETAGPGYDGALAIIGSDFGHVADHRCTAVDRIITCKLGVTFAFDGESRYEQREIAFRRDPRRGFRLVPEVKQVLVDWKGGR